MTLYRQVLPELERSPDPEMDLTNAVPSPLGPAIMGPDGRYRVLVGGGFISMFQPVPGAEIAAGAPLGKPGK